MEKKNNTGHAVSYKIFTVVFLLLLGGYFLANFVYQGPGLYSDIGQAIGKSSTLAELKKNISDLDKTMGGTILGKFYFIDTYAYIQKLLGKEETDNFWVVKDRAGLLTYANFYPDDDSGMEECARRLWRLKTAVAEKGTRVFFINPPAHHVRNVYEYSPGLPYADHNFLQDAFLYQLQRYGIDYIDLRESLAQHDEIPPEDYFFKTDHHWRIETAFAAFSDIVTWMDKTYGADIDPDGFYRNIGSYGQKKYPQSSLGSMGRATGANFSGLDDYTVIWPAFDSQTDFTYEARFLELYKPEPIRGTYTDVLMNPEYLWTGNPYLVDFYAVYQGGIKPSDKIINHKNPDGPKVLMIRDSYMLPVGVFMAPLFSEIHMIWPVSGDQQHDIETYLKENDFDYIIIEMYQENLIPGNFYYFSAPLAGE